MRKYLTAEELWRRLERSFARLGKQNDLEEFFRILVAHYYLSIRLLQHPDMIQLLREMQLMAGTFFWKPDRPVVSTAPVDLGGAVLAELTAAERKAYFWLTAHIEEEKARAAQTKRSFGGLIKTDPELKRNCRLEAGVTSRVYDFRSAFKYLPDEDKFRTSRKKTR